jgi:hypothetical protein
MEKKSWRLRQNIPEIVKMYKGGISPRKIAIKFSCSWQAIYLHLKKLGVLRPKAEYIHSCAKCGKKMPLRFFFHRKEKEYCPACVPAHYEWSKYYMCCVSCGTAEIKHNGKGLCVNCYQRERRKHSCR